MLDIKRSPYTVKPTDRSPLSGFRWVGANVSEDGRSRELLTFHVIFVKYWPETWKGSDSFMVKILERRLNFGSLFSFFFLFCFSLFLLFFCFVFFFVEDDEQYNKQINTLFRTVHIGAFNASVQVCTASFIESIVCVTELNSVLLALIHCKVIYPMDSAMQWINYFKRDRSVYQNLSSYPVDGDLSDAQCYP